MNNLLLVTSPDQGVPSTTNDQHKQHAFSEAEPWYFMFISHTRAEDLFTHALLPYYDKKYGCDQERGHDPIICFTFV